LLWLEENTDKRFGDAENPLLISTRSGAEISMPGMMDTVLNIGLNRDIVGGLAKRSGDPWFAWDCYRRFLQMYGTIVKQIEEKEFDFIIRDTKKENITSDNQLDVADLRKVTGKFEELFIMECGEAFPEDPKDQLFGAIEFVLRSWNSERAIRYRELKNLHGTFGTAVTVQAMVFGNRGKKSGSGVVFSRNPSTGEKGLDGEYLTTVQGEDVVGGIRTPRNLEDLRNEMPKVYSELRAILEKLEKTYRDVQDVEFTIEDGELFILQTRTAKQTPSAAAKILVDMVTEDLITREEALSRISSEQMERMVTDRFASEDERRIIASGLSVLPGVATGRVVFDSKDAIAMARNGERVILVRRETSPRDIVGMEAAEGVLTSRGGATSHAAIVCRDLAKPAIVGCTAILVDYENDQFKTAESTVQKGDWISLDGYRGEVILGNLPLRKTSPNEHVNELLGWVKEFPQFREKFAKFRWDVSA
jgi:pyruvate,orthophosphate dikinase